MSDSRFDSGIAGPDTLVGKRPSDRDGARAVPAGAAGSGSGSGAGSSSGNSAGALLRAAREAQGLHIAALAAAIKVSPRKLDALENDRIQDLPDATFARALAQTVCRTLKIDARPVLALLPAAGATSIEPLSRTAHAPFRERSGRDAPSLADGAVRPMVWAAVLLMVAAAVVFLVPESFWKAAVVPALDTGPVVVGAAPGDAASAGAGDVAAASAAAGSVDEAVISAVAAQAAASPPAIETVFAAPATDVPASSAAAGVVQLSSSQSSWIEVRDASGQVLLSRTVQPGENIGLDGALPMRLTIGNASSTQLGFRGMPVDLAASTRDNVARLELR